MPLGLSEAETDALLDLVRPDNEPLLDRWSEALAGAGGIYIAMDPDGRRELARGTILLIRGWLQGAEIPDRLAMRYVEPPVYRAQPLDEFVLAGMLVDRMLRDYLTEHAPSPEVAAAAVKRVDPIMAAAITRVIQLRRARAGSERVLTEIGRRLSRGTDAGAAFADAAERLAVELDAQFCVLCAIEPHAVVLLAASRAGQSAGLRSDTIMPRDEVRWLEGDDLGGDHLLARGTPGFEGVLVEAGISAVHVRPLVAQARLVGVLLLCDEAPRHMQPAHTELLNHALPLLAAHLGYARQVDATEAADAAVDDLFDASPNMLCALDKLGRIRRTNRRFRDEIGVPEDVLGMPLSWLVHPTWVERYTALWGRIERRERVAHARVDLVTANFERLPMAIEAHWLPELPVCMVALWNIARQLERQASDRRRIDDLTAFAHHIAHDLKAPLRTISGFTDLLLGELPRDANAEAQEYADRIQGAVERSGRLIDGVLRFSQSTTLEGASEAVPLANVMADVRLQLRADIEAMGGEIEVVADECPLLGQPVALTALVSNLVSNALRYSTGDRRRVEVAVRTADAGWALLTVRDYGVGIDPEDLDAIFGLFTRRATDAEGTGVGLSIVRRIADAHGGSVGVKSTLGEGSTFAVRLPTP